MNILKLDFSVRHGNRREGTAVHILFLCWGGMPMSLLLVVALQWAWTKPASDLPKATQFVLQPSGMLETLLTDSAPKGPSSVCSLALLIVGCTLRPVMLGSNFPAGTSLKTSILYIPSPPFCSAEECKQVCWALRDFTRLFR